MNYKFYIYIDNADSTQRSTIYIEDFQEIPYKTRLASERIDAIFKYGYVNHKNEEIREFYPSSRIQKIVCEKTTE